jgi:glycosyltransferase involved in cell wall biosynthesis
MIDEDIGWVFRSGDAEDLARTLRKVVATPDATIAEMGRRARLRAERQFNPRGYVEGVLDVYRGLGITC